MNTTRKFWFVLGGSILGMALIACSCSSLTPLLTSTPTPTRAPTATRMPAPTEPPAPPLAPTQATQPTTYDPLPYYDDFSDPSSGWDVYDYPEDSAGYVDGTYFVISRTTDFSSYGAAGKFFADTVIDVDATAISGPSDDNFSYNVGCRAQTNDDGYLFEISADGYFAAGYYTGGGSDYVSLLTGDDWQPSDVIWQGLDTNHFTITCNGNYLKMEVNGQVLYEGYDDTFADGDVSLGAATYDDTNKTPAEIHFDNLAVMQP